MSEFLSLAERVLKAYRKYGCYIFEAKELDTIREFIAKTGISKYVEVKSIDERYPYIYVVIPLKRGIERECIVQIESMLSRGMMTPNEYKKYKKELVEQCVVSMEKELVKKIINILEEYILGLTKSD